MKKDIKNAIFWLIIGIGLSACQQTVIFVSNKGDDTRSGTKSAPVATVQKVVELSRKSGIKKIEIQEGDYFDVSVILNKQDSGLQIVGEPGKSIRLFGGRMLEGWQQNGDIFEAKVPDSILQALDFRILIVNDTLRDRARLPENGAFNHLSEWPVQWQSSQGGWAKKPTNDDLTTLIYNPADLGSWLDVKNAELTVFHAWDDSYVGLSGIDTIKHSLRFSHRTTHPAGAFASWAGPKTHQYIVWNIKEGLKHPGQWYVDRSSRKIVYWPFAYERIGNIKVVVPTQNHIFQMDNNARSITLENLQLSCAGAPIANTGYGTANITGAILVTRVKNLKLTSISVKNVAGWAVKVTGSDISVSDCEFSYTGAGGLSYNGNHIFVQRCGIHDLGKLYFGAVGIMGNGRFNKVSHCEIYNVPYCAINSLGNQSVAEYNLIYNFKQMMVDGGAIYGGDDSTTYRNNAVLAEKGNQTEGWTYYFDELADHSTMENNLAVNTIVPVHHHMAGPLAIRNNIFIDEARQEISYPLCSDLTFTGNILVAREIIISGPTGEKGNTKKESLNAVFQRYFDCNGITKFEGNQFLSDTVVHDVLHLYSPVRREPFRYGAAQWTKNPEVRVSWYTKIPEGFDETGYRKNFKQVYSKMTGVME
jgi:hypothetical protein